MANPPFSALDWWEPIEVNKEVKIDKNGNEKEVAPNYKKDLKDPHSRFIYGTPPRKKADLAFVQHMVASLKESGRMGVVVPHGVLFREGDEGKIRKALLIGNEEAGVHVQGDIIEAVIGLPTGLFYNTGIAAAVLLINKNKPAALKNKVVFIDASADFEEGKNQNKLRDQDIARISSAMEKAVSTLVNAGEQTQEQMSELLDAVAVDKYLRVVPLQEIQENDYNLNISRYIDTSEPEEVVDISIVLEKLKEIDLELGCVDKKLTSYIKELSRG